MFKHRILRWIHRWPMDTSYTMDTSVCIGNTEFFSVFTSYTKTETDVFILIKLPYVDSFLCETGSCENFRAKVFSTTSTIVRQAGLCEIYSTTDFSTTSTFVRQFLVRQGFLCDKLFCATNLRWTGSCAANDGLGKTRLWFFCSVVNMTEQKIYGLVVEPDD